MTVKRFKLIIVCDPKERFMSAFQNAIAFYIELVDLNRPSFSLR